MYYDMPTPSGTYSVDANGKWIWRRNPDSHGGHSAEHRMEMMMIAEEVTDRKIKEIIPKIQAEAL